MDAGQIAALTEANGKDDSLVVLNAYMTPAGTEVYKTMHGANGNSIYVHATKAIMETWYEHIMTMILVYLQ